MVRLKEVFKSKMEGTDARAHLPAHVLPQSVQVSLLNIFFYYYLPHERIYHLHQMRE